MTACPLTAPDAPITEGARTWIALAMEWTNPHLHPLPIPCPRCGVTVGSCRTKGGRALSTPHVGRGSA